MQSVFDQGLPPATDGPFNMAAHVLGRAAELAGKPALEIIGPSGARVLSFGGLETAVRGIGTGLLQLNLSPGARVLMRLGNTAEFPLTYLACIAVGLVPVPTSSQLTGNEVEKLCNTVTPSLIVASPGVSLPENPPCPVLDASELEAMHSLEPAEYAMGDAERPAYIIFTSGTSGQQRAVCHAHRAILARQMMFDGWYGLHESDRLMHAGAFNWTYTLGCGLMDPWTVGATALIPAPGTKPADLPGLIKEHKATIFAAAPGVYRQILKSSPDISAKHLRHGLSAGEKLPATTREVWTKATGTPVFEAYGMSECSTFISGSPGNPAKDGALGTPQTGRRVAILDPDGKVVPCDTGGELCVSRRDPGLMLGYYEAEEETRAKFTGEWFRTGDSATMDSDGVITYQGRTDDMMNAGGYRVSPVEVEAALSRHENIRECAVAEVQVKADVNVIAAFYVTDADPGEKALKDFAARNLARYKCPRVFVPVAEIPKGGNGKILRRELREKWKVSQ